MNIKAVTFDVGSTLLYPNPSEGELFYQVATRLGLKVDKKILPNLVQRMYDEVYALEEKRNPEFWSGKDSSKEIWYTLYRWLSREAGCEKHQDQIADAVYGEYLKGENWALYEDVIPTLDALKDKNIKLAVISNWDCNLPYLLKDIGLSDYFDIIIPSAQYETRKPEKKIFEIALHGLSVNAKEVIHVGDMEEADGYGASQLGITPLIINRDRRLLSGKYQSINSLIDIARFL